MSDEKRVTEVGNILRVPLLPVRDTPIFPHIIVPLFVGRPGSIEALNAAAAPESNGQILVVAQRRPETDNPLPDEVHSVGTVGRVRESFTLPDGTLKVLIEGQQRAAIRGYIRTETFLEVDVEPLPDHEDVHPDLEVLVRNARANFDAYQKANKGIPPEVSSAIWAIESPSHLADAIAARVPLPVADKQFILESRSPSERLRRLSELIPSLKGDKNIQA